MFVHPDVGVELRNGAVTCDAGPLMSGEVGEIDAGFRFVESPLIESPVVEIGRIEHQRLEMLRQVERKAELCIADVFPALRWKR